MRKKLALPTNLIHEPPIPLLDEPGLGVDPLSRRELWTLLEDFRSQGAAIVLATSYMDEADRCDRLMFLHEGLELVAGSPRELKETVAGTAFEIDTTDPGSVEQQLAAMTSVRGAARLPGKVRFQFGKALSGEGSASLQTLPGARAVTPQLEDIFTAKAPAGSSVAAVAAPWAVTYSNVWRCRISSSASSVGFLLLMAFSRTREPASSIFVILLDHDLHTVRYRARVGDYAVAC